MGAGLTRGCSSRAVSDLTVSAADASTAAGTYDSYTQNRACVSERVLCHKSRCPAGSAQVKTNIHVVHVRHERRVDKISIGVRLHHVGPVHIHQRRFNKLDCDRFVRLEAAAVIVTVVPGGNRSDRFEPLRSRTLPWC